MKIYLYVLISKIGRMFKCLICLFKTFLLIFPAWHVFADDTNPLQATVYQQNQAPLFRSSGFADGHVVIAAVFFTVISFLLVCRTRSLQKKLADAKEELKAGEFFYREFIEGSQDLFTKVNASGELVFVNNAAAEFFGMRPADCIGVSAFQFIHEEDRERTVCAFRQWVQDRVPSAVFENRQVSVTGDVRHMLWNIIFHYAGNGELKYVNSIARDISSGKESERRLQEAENILREKVPQASRESFCEEIRGIIRLLRQLSGAIKIKEVKTIAQSIVQAGRSFGLREIEQAGLTLLSQAEGYKIDEIAKTVHAFIHFFESIADEGDH